MSTHTRVQEDLRLEIHETDLQLLIHFHGCSDARDPSVFLLPILTDSAERARNHGQELILDFRRLQRMNSSTVGVIVRIVDDARRNRLRIRVVYDQASRWQRVCFTALGAFDTPSHRIHFAAM